MKHALASAMLGVGLVFSLGTAKADVLVLTSPQIADNGTLAVKRKNAVIKITGACTLSKEPYPFRTSRRPLARVFDAWGFERCLWGTDWTRAFAVVNYEQAVEPFLKTDRLSASERAMLMGGATAKAYGWSPKKV